MGKCPSPQSADGSTPENQRCYLEISAFDHRHLSSVDLPQKGAVIPMMVLPSLIGIMLGSFVGVRILKVAKPTFIRWMVIGILLFAGLKAISKGLESYGVTFF